MRLLFSYGAIAAIAFALHALWEKTHLPLYQGYEGISGSLPVWLYATLGDVGYTMLAVLVIALLKRNIDWILEVRAVDFALLLGTGFLIAFGVEYKAMLLARWAYTPMMPTILGFGLSPLVQMTLLLPLSVYLAQKLTRGTA